MKKITIKLKFDLLADLLQWLETAMADLGADSGTGARCIYCVLLKLRNDKLMPKTFFRYKGEAKVSLLPHEAFALLWASEWAPPHNYPYLSTFLTGAAMAIHQKFA